MRFVFYRDRAILRSSRQEPLLALENCEKALQFRADSIEMNALRAVLLQRLLRNAEATEVAEHTQQLIDLKGRSEASDGIYIWNLMQLVLFELRGKPEDFSKIESLIQLLEESDASRQVKRVFSVQ